MNAVMQGYQPKVENEANYAKLMEINNMISEPVPPVQERETSDLTDFQMNPFADEWVSIALWPWTTPISTTSLFSFLS